MMHSVYKFGGNKCFCQNSSGLDSYAALTVVETLKKLCANGCTVITSIHQPRSSIFKLFDDIIILSGGNLVYHGPAGDDALKYFEGKGYPCPPYYNPADFFLDLVSVDRRSENAKSTCRARIDFLVQEYRKAFDNRTVKRYSFNRYSQVEIDKTVQCRDAIVSQPSKVSKISQLNALSLRSLRQMIRDRKSFVVRVSMNIIFAVFISGVYSSTNGNFSQQSIIDRQGVLFFMCILQSM